MSVQRRPEPPAGRLLSWAVTAVLIGWILAYNILRIGGDSPRGAAWISLAIGGAVGLLVLGAVYLTMRRFAPEGLSRGPLEVPAPDRMDEGQRAAIRIAIPLLGALAVVALVMAVVLGVDWIRSAHSIRSHVTLLILALWNLLMAAVALELPRMRRYDVEGIDTIPYACAVTAVLGGVGITKHIYPVGQEILILVAGVAGIATQLAVWRLSGRRWSLVVAIGIAVVAALSLALPLAF